MPLKVYDETLRILKNAVQRAKLGRDEELGALQRLDDQARKLEGLVSGPSVDAFIANERAQSPMLGGRSVFGWEAELVSREPERAAAKAAPSSASGRR